MKRLVVLAGLAALAELPAERVATYQPYWALRAHLLSRLLRAEEAEEAYARAIGLCSDDAMRKFLIAAALVLVSASAEAQTVDVGAIFRARVSVALSRGCLPRPAACRCDWPCPAALWPP